MNFAGTWSRNTTYLAGAVVVYGNQTFYARKANRNYTPSPTSKVWSLLATNGMDYQGTWSASAAYQVGAVVSAGPQMFYSLQSPNTNQDPFTQTDYWAPVGTNGNTLHSGPGAPPANVGVEGDFWIDTTATTIQGPKTSAGWPVMTTSLFGPQGPRGEPGSGGTGPTGPAGATGPAGPAGPTGPTGPAGPAGAVGPIGPAGAAGAIGPAGPAGQTGAVGPMGPAGPAGAAGSMGPTGPAGPTGATGPMGPAGPTGATGPAGSAAVAYTAISQGVGQGLTELGRIAFASPVTGKAILSARGQCIFSIPTTYSELRIWITDLNDSIGFDFASGGLILTATNNNSFSAYPWTAEQIVDVVQGTPVTYKVVATGFGNPGCLGTVKAQFFTQLLQ